MRIETFLEHSPVFCINVAARRFEAATAQLLSEDGLTFLEALVLSALFFEAPRPVKPSQLAETFSTTRGNISHCISGLEAKGLVQRRLAPDDARAFHLLLRPQGKRTAMRVIGALDRMQRLLEEEVGKAALQSAIRTVRTLTATCERT